MVSTPGVVRATDASSTSSFGVPAPPPIELENTFTLTHRSLSPVPEERESMCISTRSSQYTQYTSDDDATVAATPEARTVAQQYRDSTLAHRGPSPVQLPHFVAPLPTIPRCPIPATPVPLLPSPPAGNRGTFGAYPGSPTEAGSIL